ncbi:uncharacterized protein PgNI_00148 [Pyricularia grisea]|uniref:Rhodopsin domain-containing protein n=1 Tax=Pyricularia grisea TaxID=148305 RepID=A0A6P8BJ36_PYRGI|nr:uncharacterized protein PgNI_00148 [Pyricularia grisea]TLD16669.1 hypothetical protein PgNI_00148 [Pyricularia grisea]
MAPLNETLRQRVQGHPHVRLNTSGLSFPESSPFNNSDLEGFVLLDDINSTAGFDERAVREVETGLWVLVTLSALFLSLRLYCKRKNPTSKLRWEDAVLAASWMMLILNAALATLLIHMGLGSPDFALTPDNIEDVVLLGLSSLTTGIVAQAWSKTSFAMTLLRMTEGWWHNVVLISIVTVNVFFGVSAALFWVGCDPIEKKWRPLMPGKCDDGALSRAATFGVIVSVYSGLVDILLAILPWPILLKWTKKTSSDQHLCKREKIGVAIAMSIGIFAGITAFVKARYMTSFYNISIDLGDDVGRLTTWSAAETAVTIMATSIPVLRVLVRDVANKEGRRLASTLASSRLAYHPKRTSSFVSQKRPLTSPPSPTPTTPSTPRPRSLVETHDDVLVPRVAAPSPTVKHFSRPLPLLPYQKEDRSRVRREGWYVLRENVGGGAGSNRGQSADGAVGLVGRALSGEDPQRSSRGVGSRRERASEGHNIGAVEKRRFPSL